MTDWYLERDCSPLEKLGATSPETPTFTADPSPATLTWNLLEKSSEELDKSYRTIAVYASPTSAA